jgi:hypothetical protein
MINIIAESLLIGYKPAIEVGINISGSCYSTIMQLTVFLCLYERPPENLPYLSRIIFLNSTNSPALIR